MKKRGKILLNRLKNREPFNFSGSAGNPVKYLFIGLIRLYKLFISPLVPPSCRFYPSCSVYSAEALRKHGAVKGLYLAGRRIMRCNPYCEGGYDPVPETFNFNFPSL